MKKSTLVILCLAMCLYTSPAHAYLDPGTGNLLVYLLVSTVSIALYSVKNVFFTLTSKLGLTRSFAPSSHYYNTDLVIFSEGKTYWSTFEPVVKELIKQKFTFRYLSMDIEDPGLAIENPYMLSRYVGRGSAAFARLARVKAHLMLETTPNIGTPGYPMPVPKNVRRLAHVLHGVGDIGFYAKNAFDTCHILFTMNSHMEKSIRTLERKRNLPPKECIPVGLPYFDTLAEKSCIKEGVSQPPVILIAPSWGGKNCLLLYGTDFISWLADANFTIIVRPHPASFTNELQLIHQLEELVKCYPNIRIDSNLDGSASFQAADLMISDKSGIRLDFAFLYEKPVLTLEVPLNQRETFEASELDYVWEDEIGHQIGKVITDDEFRLLDAPAFISIVNDNLAISRESLRLIKDTSVAHIGHAGEKIAHWVMHDCQSKNIMVER